MPFQFRHRTHADARAWFLTLPASLRVGVMTSAQRKPLQWLPIFNYPDGSIRYTEPGRPSGRLMGA